MPDPSEDERVSSETPETAAAGIEDPEGLEALLEYLRRQRGFDFGGYKKSSLSRRIQRRMQAVSMTNYADYLDYLQVHPDEFSQLFNTVLINVTSFFRDAPVWDALRAQIERIVEAKAPDAPIRVWSAGCASGEEAYSLAMSFAEVMGLESFARRVKIYATDIDDEALADARTAAYSPKAVEGVPVELLEKYFAKSGGSFVFHKDARRSVIFGRHDLVQDAPISRADVLTCRNTMMYFNAETQTRVLNRLHFAMAGDGVLMLGKAEMLLTHANLFTPIDLKLRLFSRAGRGRLRERTGLSDGFFANAGASANSNVEGPRFHGVAFDSSPVAQVALDASNRVVLVNRKASSLWPISKKDIGKPFHDLELSYRPVELRSLIDQVKSELRPIRIKDVERQYPSGEKRFLDVEIAPLSEQGEALGVQISFSDSSHTQLLQAELKKLNLELETSHEELQSTSEELETTNEELQSTVEELETTNEELQSTNEELETINEELQSSNEELHTMNDELRQRGEDLKQANVFLGSILASLRSGVAVLDGDLRIKAWSEHMTELWGVRADEAVGNTIATLDIGLPVARILDDLRACLASPRSAPARSVLQCTDRRGHALTCRVNVSPLVEEGTRGVILIVEEEGEV